MKPFSAWKALRRQISQAFGGLSLDRKVRHHANRRCAMEPLELRTVLTHEAVSSAGGVVTVDAEESEIENKLIVDFGEFYRAKDSTTYTGKISVTDPKQDMPASGGQGDGIVFKLAPSAITKFVFDLSNNANGDSLSFTDAAVAQLTGLTEVIVNSNDGPDNIDLWNLPASVKVTINGGRGRDTLKAAEFGESEINGGDGPDMIYGGRGDDKLIGGAGDDTIDFDYFYKDSDSYDVNGAGNDVIIKAKEIWPEAVAAVDWHTKMVGFKSSAPVVRWGQGNAIKFDATGVKDKGGDAGPLTVEVYRDSNGDGVLTIGEGTQVETDEYIGQAVVDGSDKATISANLTGAEPKGRNTYFGVSKDVDGYGQYIKATVTLADPQVKGAQVDDFQHSGSFTVSIDEAIEDALEMDVAVVSGVGSATEGSDFSLDTTNVTIPAGQTSATIDFTVFGDDYDEGDEDFQIELTVPQEDENGNTQPLQVATGDATIRDVSVRVDTALSVSEADGNAYLNVYLSAPPFESSVTVYYATADGSAKADGPDPGDYDYTASEYYVTIDPDNDYGFIEIPINDDDEMEGIEDFYVNWSGPAEEFAFFMGDDQSTITIDDNDEPPSIHVDDGEVNEEDGSVQVHVWLEGYDHGIEFTVHYVTSPGTADSEVDYAWDMGTLTFGLDNDRDQYVTVYIIDDNDAEQDEDFTFEITNIDGGAWQDFSTGEGKITIKDNEAPDAEDDEVSTPKDTPLAIGVMDNDSDPDGDEMTIESFTQGSNGSVGLCRKPAGT